MTDLDNILLSVKTQLGIPEEVVEFDPSLILNINSAFSTLSQIGVGSDKGFLVVSGEEKYSDFLEDQNALSLVKMYLYYKTRLIFDPPSSSMAAECIKESIKETEWRLRSVCDISKGGDDGGESG